MDNKSLSLTKWNCKYQNNISLDKNKQSVILKM